MTERIEVEAPEYFARFAAGDEIFSEGETGSEMYIIQDGQVEIVKELEGEERRLAVLEEGDFFGEMAILEDLPRSASARALTACVVLRMDRPTFNSMARQNPEIPVRMLRKLCRRLRDTDPLLLDIDPGDTISAGIRLTRDEATGRIELGKDQETHAKLVHPASESEFHLSPGPETLIGRYDAAAGICPDIDLREVDPQYSISRRHAKIVRGDGCFYLLEEVGTTNGTYINSNRLSTGKKVRLQHGDQVRFGLVDTVFTIH